MRFWFVQIYYILLWTETKISENKLNFHEVSILNSFSLKIKKIIILILNFYSNTLFLWGILNKIFIQSNYSGGYFLFIALCQNSRFITFYTWKIWKNVQKIRWIFYIFFLSFFCFFLLLFYLSFFSLNNFAFCILIFIFSDFFYYYEA